MPRDIRERWRRRLLEERELATAAIASADRDARSVLESGYSDAARDGEEERDSVLELGNVVTARGNAEVQAIDEALERLVRDPEHFGTCEVCGAPIPEVRLDLVPWTRRCRAHAGRAYE